MGSVEKRGKKHRAKVRIEGVSLTETFDTKPAAWAWVHEAERKIKAGLPHGQDKRTLSDLLERFAGDRKRDWDKTRLAWFCQQSIAKLKLSEVTPLAVEAWIEERKKVVSDETIRRDLALLSAAFTRGIKFYKWIDESPLSAVTRPDPGEARDRIASQKEVETICYVAGYEPGTRPATIKARVAAAFVFATETAMMPVEISKLDRSWIAGNAIKCPKVKTRPRREVPLSKAAKQVLEDVGYCFDLTPGQIDAHWREHIRPEAAVEGLNFYDARATCLTRLAKTYDPLQLAKIAGHKDLNRILNTYYRESAEEMAKRME